MTANTVADAIHALLREAVTQDAGPLIFVKRVNDELRELIRQGPSSPALNTAIGLAATLQPLVVAYCETVHQMPPEIRALFKRELRYNLEKHMARLQRKLSEGAT